MANSTAHHHSAQQRAEQGLFSKTLHTLIQAILFLFMTLLLSILIEWAGMATDFWEQPGSQHSQSLLQQELGYLNQDFRRSVLVEQPMQFAQRFADQFYRLMFKQTGIETVIITIATPTPNHNESHFRRRLRYYYHQTEEYILAAMTITQLFAVRLAVLTLALPAFMLLAAFGLIDGLVQRDIRRWSGGRESSFVYHWAKRILYPSLILPWIIYLAMPDSIHPNAIVLPFALLFAIAVRIMASTFKKYL